MNYSQITDTLHAINPDAFENGSVKPILEDLVSSMLDQIEALGREPDPWERHFLAGAIGGLGIGFYVQAAVCLALMNEPPEKRAPLPIGDHAKPRDFLTIKLLRDELERVRLTPARDWTA